MAAPCTGPTSVATLKGLDERHLRLMRPREDTTTGEVQQMLPVVTLVEFALATAER
jgi:hypothetical protein